MRNDRYENITITMENTTLDMLECMPLLSTIIEKTLKMMVDNKSYNCRLWQFHHHRRSKYFSMKISRSSDDVYPKIHISVEDPDALKSALEENYFEIFTLDGVRNIFDKEKMKTIFIGPILPGEYLGENGHWVEPMTN